MNDFKVEENKCYVMGCGMVTGKLMRTKCAWDDPFVFYDSRHRTYYNENGEAAAYRGSQHGIKKPFMNLIGEYVEREGSRGRGYYTFKIEGEEKEEGNFLTKNSAIEKALTVCGKKKFTVYEVTEHDNRVFVDAQSIIKKLFKTIAEKTNQPEKAREWLDKISSGDNDIKEDLKRVIADWMASYDTQIYTSTREVEKMGYVDFGKPILVKGHPGEYICTLDDGMVVVGFPDGRKRTYPVSEIRNAVE